MKACIRIPDSRLLFTGSGTQIQLPQPSNHVIYCICLSCNKNRDPCCWSSALTCCHVGLRSLQLWLEAAARISTTMMWPVGTSVSSEEDYDKRGWHQLPRSTGAEDVNRVGDLSDRLPEHFVWSFRTFWAQDSKRISFCRKHRRAVT